MKPSNSLRRLGYACLVCGLLLFTNGVLAELSEGGRTSNYAMNLVANLAGNIGAFGFLLAFLGLQSIKAAGSGWLPKLSGGLILISMMFGLGGSFYTQVYPNSVQYLTPLGSALVTLGWLAYGIGVLRTRVLQRWQRFVPLMLGLFFFLQLPLQILFFISVRGRPNYLIVVGGYGVLIALLGYTMLFVEDRPILVTT
jgi:hypothetical protein